MIKYRVYDTEQKRYLNINSVSISGSGILIVTNYEDGYYMSISQLPNENSPRFIIEQYTGLKDKNGMEIAVGDILIDDTGEFVEHWSVSFSDGSFIGEYAGVSESLSELTDLEVIGNIHENSKLLDDKDKNVPSKER